MSCTPIDLCTTKIKAKPKTTAESQLNWAIMAHMQKWICCLQKLDVVTGMQTIVFGNIIVPTTSFAIPLVTPLVDRELIEVEWNGQDIYHVSEIPTVPLPEMAWSISDNNILLTTAVGNDALSPDYIAVKVLTKKKIVDALVCPELTVVTPCDPCNC